MIKKGHVDSGVRPASTSDINELVEIDYDARCDAWDEAEWRSCLKDPDRTVYVAILGDVLGAIVTRQVKNSPGKDWMIEKLVVSPESRRKGVGAALVRHVRARMDKLPMRRLLCHVAESALGAQQFLKAQGFRASPKPVRQPWGEEYEFALKAGMPKWGGRNRIGDFWTQLDDSCSGTGME